jgi:hypothetical protein
MMTYLVTQVSILPVSGTISRIADDGSNTITLTLSGNTGTSIQWQSSSDGTIFSNIIAATTSTFVSTITATTYYRVQVSNAFGDMAFTSILKVEFTRKNPTIGALTVPQDKLIGDGAFILADPMSDSNGAFTYTSSNAAVATISGSTVSIVGKGTTTITATQAAFGEYNSGSVLEVLMVANNDTSLAVFTVNDVSVEEGSTVNLPARTKSVSVVATPTDPNATVLITGDSTLLSGNNTLTVTVTAEDCTTKIYTVTLQVRFDNLIAQRAMLLFF